ncbi:hypothetical protein ARMGADRAFT_1034237 [Armillaria gallica]|uniref:Uncharacterized protein n=1 Tax=Armillaria gallica TaxID=47427 RepID=A0A2H3D2H5_ARMGA|nr:hypothetical protein ARMGADRAFT_1034237 [Armillaria gallica]
MSLEGFYVTFPPFHGSNKIYTRAKISSRAAIAVADFASGAGFLARENVFDDEELKEERPHGMNMYLDIRNLCVSKGEKPCQSPVVYIAPRSTKPYQACCWRDILDVCVAMFDGHVETSYTQFMKRLRIKLLSGARRFTQDATGSYATLSEDPISGTLWRAWFQQVYSPLSVIPSRKSHGGSLRLFVHQRITSKHQPNRPAWNCDLDTAKYLGLRMILWQICPWKRAEEFLMALLLCGRRAHIFAGEACAWKLGTLHINGFRGANVGLFYSGSLYLAEPEETVRSAEILTRPIAISNRKIVLIYQTCRDD